MLPNIDDDVNANITETVVVKNHRNGYGEVRA